LAALPRVDWPAAHALSDQLALAANEQRFETFYDLLLDSLAHLLATRARDPDEAARPAIPPHRLPAWAGLWEELLREKTDAQLLNLDRKALILGAFARLEAVAKG
jgi:DNA polymerase III subunit delta'